MLPLRQRPQGGRAGARRHAQLLRRLLMGLLGWVGAAQAGVLVQMPEPLTLPPLMPAQIQAAPITLPPIEAGPIEPLPLRRIDEQDQVIASEVEALIHLAEISPAPGSSKSKRRPLRNTEELAPGSAAWTLGLIYLHGAGVPQAPAHARAWFERALQLGQRQALAGLAWCAIDGCGRMPDPAAAQQWIEPLRAVNRPLALYLQWLAEDRLKPLRTATPDLKSSSNAPPLPDLKLLLASAKAGNVHALIELGLDAVARQQPDKALAYFQRAAPASEVAAINAAIMASTLRPAPPAQHDDQKLALELLNEAQRAHRGDGQPVNYAEAIRLYRLAAAKGNTEASRMLALIYSRPLINGGFDIGWISQLGQLDWSHAAPSLRSPTLRRQLSSERTPLIDLLPAKWRARIT